MICAFFGHRTISENIDSVLHEALVYLIEKRGVDTFYVGNHGAFDRKVEWHLSRLKEKYDIQAEIVLAYLNDKEYLLDTVYPEGIECVSPKYAIVYRNEWMIERADIVLCYVKNSYGGAYRFKTIAEKKGKEVINIGS